MLTTKQPPSSYYKDLGMVAKSILVGHDDALAKILKRLELYKSGMIDKHRPIGSFLLAGPTGCGKTTLAQAIAFALHGNQDTFIRIDCGEYQNSHEVAKLIGAPPGYLGHRETEAVLSKVALQRVRSPNSSIVILLLDEVEKADNALTNILLGVMDAGRITLGDNTHVDMCESILLMTSNLGVKEASDTSFGLSKLESSFVQKQATVTNAIKKRFSPEFRNRLDAVLILSPLTPIQAHVIAAREINKFVSHCPATIKVTKSLIHLLVERGYSEEFGARDIKRIIEQDMMMEVARIILNNKNINKNTTIYIDAIQGEIKYRYKIISPVAAATVE